MSVPPTSPWVKSELQYLQKHPDWHTKWEAALIDSAVGNPRPYRRFPSASANLIHQAYQISHFESTTGMAIANYGSILEIGGGFGAACRLIHRLGGSPRYEILDLPTLSVLQNLYLTAVGLIDPFVDEDVRVRTVSTTAYDAGPEPSHAPELIIASWSLSETPMQFRQSIGPLLRSAESLLINYQETFDAVDNRRYFEDLTTLGDWQEIYQGQHAHMPGSHFLYMVRS